MRRRISTALIAVAALLVAFSGYLLISGAAAVVVTHGVSMQPLYTEGDLVVVTRAPAYSVGDIVAYRLTEDRSVVLHRIVGGDGDAFTLQGDNNATIDPESPDADQIVGRAALHLPQGGLWLERITSPPAVAAIAFVLLTGAGAATTSRRRRKRKYQEMSQHAARQRPVPGIRTLTPGLKALSAIALVTGVVGLGLGAYSWSGPLSETTTSSSQTARMEFGYSAQVEPGPAYDGTEVSAPDAVFRNVVDIIDAKYAYTGAPGRLTLTAELSAEGGWRSTVPLSAPDDIAGDGRVNTVTLDLSALDARAQEAAAVIGIPITSLNIAVTPSVRTDAGGEFQPALNLVLTQQRLSLAEGADNLIVTGDETTSMAVSPRLLGPSNWTITAEAGRIASILLVAFALVLLAGVALLARRAPAPVQAEAIKKRYGALLVEVQPIASGTQQIADVREFSDLAKLAEQFQLPVLHWAENATEVFMVRDDGISYRYRSSDVARASAAPKTPADGSVSAVPQP